MIRNFWDRVRHRRSRVKSSRCSVFCPCGEGR